MSENTLTANGKTDLTNCDREPIHIPGSIQPHGAILAIEESTLKIVQTSANSQEILGFAPEELLGQTWGKVLPAESLEYLKTQILPKNLEALPHYLPTIKMNAGKQLEAIIHRYQNILILELEQKSPKTSDISLELYASLKSTLVHLEATSSVEEFCRKATEKLREFTGFDRVMIYRFAEDDSGEVIAESKRENLESFLGLHYPASDIPKQARELYVKSWLRFKVDNDAAPVALVPEINPQTGKPLDMSYAVLRSMSPMHTEYLRNMGVQSTMSLSIIKDEKLWGLVACHHYAAPRYVSHDIRMACEFLEHFLSLQMANKEASENYEYIQHLNKRHSELVELMTRSQDFIQTLVEEGNSFLDWIKADGAAFVVEDEIHLIGKTPPSENVSSIFQWLSENTTDEIYAIDNLPAVCADAAHCRNLAAGVMAMRLSRNLPHFIIWIRSEISQRVHWAGDPNKPVENGASGDILSPRKSFALWIEEVGGKSKPWKPCEIEAAANFRHSIMEIVVRRAEALAQLNVELRRSNTELDSFAYIASHDLKEPLRGIHNFSHILIETYSDKLPVDGQQKLQTLMRLTQRMESLIESLLHYSRIGRTQLSLTEVKLNKMLQDTLEMIQPRLLESKAEIRVAENLPTIRGDEVLLREVFTNLLTNAIKYNDKEKPLIEIGIKKAETPVFFVRDNGIGIPEKHHEQIFRIFKRLHGRDSFGGGVGAGLTIAEKIIERHGGKIWLESVPQEGTTFYFTIGTTEKN